jgi:hypothetical protein
VNDKFTAEHALSAVNADSLQTTQFQQRMLIHCKQHDLTMKTDSLQGTPFGSET